MRDYPSAEMEVVANSGVGVGRAHLREAVLRHEESQRLHRMCRELRGKEALQAELRRVHRRATETYTTTDEEDDFRELLDPPRIIGEFSTSRIT